MTKCYKIIGKNTKQIQGDTFLKLEGVHVDVEVPFYIYLNTVIGRHFASCQFDGKSKSYKVLDIFSEGGGIILKNKK